jgi:hypothetical protein
MSARHQVHRPGRHRLLAAHTEDPRPRLYQSVPDPAEPLAVAAYNEASRQLAAEVKAEAHAEPEPSL